MSLCAQNSQPTRIQPVRRDMALKQTVKNSIRPGTNSDQKIFEKSSASQISSPDIFIERTIVSLRMSSRCRARLVPYKNFAVTILSSVDTPRLNLWADWYFSRLLAQRTFHQHVAGSRLLEEITRDEKVLLKQQKTKWELENIWNPKKK